MQGFEEPDSCQLKVQSIYRGGYSSPVRVSSRSISNVGGLCVLLYHGWLSTDETASLQSGEMLMHQSRLKNWERTTKMFKGYALAFSVYQKGRWAHVRSGCPLSLTCVARLSRDA